MGKTVIVPYKEGMDILEKLETAQNMSDEKKIIKKDTALYGVCL